jgi:hypothetical protein
VNSIKDKIIRTYEYIKKRPTLAVFMGTLIFILAIVILFTYSNVLVYNYNPNRSGQITGLGKGQPILPALVQYDSGHYKDVAIYGYNKDINAAFLPLFPLSIRLVHKFILNIDLASLIAAWSFLVFAVIAFYKFIESEVKKHNLKFSPYIVLGLIAIFPTSFYFAIPYTESLFLLLSSLAFLTYRRNLYYVSAIFAFLASLTKYQGLVFGLYVLVDVIYKKRDFIRRSIPMIFAGLGFLSYMYYLYVKYKNPFEFLKVEKYWGRDYGNILMNLVHSFRPEYIWYIPVIVIALYGVYKYLERPFFWYGLVYLLLPLSNGRIDALNRYVLTDLPLFLGLAAVYLAWNKVYRFMYVFGSGYLLCMSIMLFANSYLVA